jgi:Family of unknown function (DUF6159)
MSRWRQGWALTKKSWAVLKSHRELLRFPIYGALLAVALVIVLVGPGVYLIDDGQRVAGGLLVALGLYGSSFVSIYFGVALAATADKIFQGQPATIADGFAVARSHLGAIAGWAALAALVGTIISLIQQSGSIGEAIIGTLIGAAWGLITFLAVPVITFEGTGPFTTLKRSATLFKDRWQGQVTGNVAIGGIVFLVGIIPAGILIALGVYLWTSDDGGAGIAAGALIALVGVVILVAAGLVVQALKGVFGVALYRFASAGELTPGFTAEDLNSAVRLKKS